MRHLVSILLAPVLGAIAYVLIGVGFAKQAGDGWSSDTIIALAAVLAGGAAYAVLLLPRWSPLGTGLVGALYLGLTFWVISDPSSFQDATPDDLLGVDQAARVPAGGITALLAVPLLVTLASSRRWRRLAYPQAPLPAGPPAYNTPPPPPFSNQPPAFGNQPSGFDQPPAYNPPDPYSAPPAPTGYPNNPIGAPYSGPPSYSPGSPVASNYPDYPDQQPPYGGAPPPFSPEQTRRL